MEGSSRKPTWWWLSALVAIALHAGCGADDAAPGPSDAGIDSGPFDAARPEAAVPACWEPSLELPCCYSHDNAGDDTPAVRVVGLDLDLPIALADPLTEIALAHAFRVDQLTLVIERAAGEDGGMPIVRAGPALEASGDPTADYLWYRGGAPEPGLPDRWDPRVAPVVEDGGVWSTTMPVDGEMVLPVYDEHAVLTAELHLRDATFDRIDPIEDGSCLGTIGSDGLTWMLGTARMRAFIPVEPSKIGLLPQIAISICQALSATPCDQPQSTWIRKPDAICDETGCRAGDCTPEETCNAFRFDCAIGGAGVEVR